VGQPVLCGELPGLSRTHVLWRRWRAGTISPTSCAPGERQRDPSLAGRSWLGL